MNAAILKKTLATATFGVLAGFAGTASAHTIANKSLGSAAGATDTYQLGCGSGTANIVAAVSDNTKDTVRVSVQAIKYNSYVAGNRTDQIGGDGKYSPFVKLSNLGSGVYYVLVDKDKAGAQSYSVQAHCHDSAGGEVTNYFSPTNQNQ
jgi:hypothetical protein